MAGVWFDDTARGAVELRPCPAGLCGHIVWLKEPTDANGAPRTDAYNPDPSKRSRPICGLQVIGNVKQQSDGTWDQGWVYDPKAGKAYDVAIEMPARDRLTVTGYKGIKLLSKTLVWTRARPTCRGAHRQGGARTAHAPAGGLIARPPKVGANGRSADGPHPQATNGPLTPAAAAAALIRCTAAASSRRCVMRTANSTVRSTTYVR